MKRVLKTLLIATGFVVLTALIPVLTSFPGGAQAQAGSGYELVWSSFGGVQGTSSGDGYQLQSYSGQFSPGIITSGGYTITMFPVSDAASPPLLIGDVNGDGNIDVADAILILRHIVGLVTLSGDGLEAADVNQDDQVDVADAILILRYVVGLVPSLPIE